MLHYVVGRLIQSVLTITLAAILVFLAVRLTPGDPAELLLPRGAPPEQIAAVRQAWGLDDPLPVQFALYLRNLAQGDLGISRTYHEPVLDVILDRLPATLTLASAAILLAILIAIPLGVLSSLRPGSVFDNATTTLSITTQSIPSFFLGVQLILIFSLWLSILPASGSTSPKHLILPAITLAADSTALMIRIIRTEMIRVMRQEYIRVAFAKGLRRKRVIIGHAFRNAANPLVTIVGLRFGALLGGAVVTETIFAWPGIGRLVIQSVFARDYALIQGIVLVAAVLFTTVHLLVDVIYALLDPRIHYGRG